MIKQAIIPLAGLGTRLLPLTSVFAKELLPINGKPGIEYILDECIDAGISEIIFIISKKKEISICGELSSNINYLNEFIDIGISSLSMPPMLIPKIKEEIRSLK